MATDENRSGTERDPEELARRLIALTARSQRLGQELLVRQARQATAAEFSLIDVAGVSRVFLEASAKLAADPAKLARAQAALWQDSLALWRRTLGGAADERTDGVGEPDPADRRFKDAAWREHPLFDPAEALVSADLALVGIPLWPMTSRGSTHGRGRRSSSTLGST